MSSEAPLDFPFANAPDIIRANQKDTYVEVQLRDGIRELVQWFKGVRFLNSLGPEIDAASTFTYLALTTLVGARTLGEEYTDLFYLTPSLQIPNWKRRGAYVLTAGLIPILLHRYFGKLKNKLLARMKEDSLLYSIVESVQPATVSTVNLGLFYFFGSYYQLSKRIFGLRYAFGHRVNPLDPKGSYEFLGLLMVAQAFVKLVNAVRARYRAADPEKPVESTEIDLEDPEVLPQIPENSRVCSLCFDPIKSPAATKCGHIFCWSCVSEWCRVHSECPICRQSCDEQNLLVLQA